jgi:H+/Cl- antiporter ClcA
VTAVSAPTPPSPAPELPVTREREFWPLVGLAIVLGIFGAFFSLAFLISTGKGGHWWHVSNVSWGGGHWWWVAVTGATGIAVGVLRHFTKLPWETPGLVEDLQTEHVEPKLVPGIILVSAASLIGGASLGPEKPIGSGGGWASGWLARRYKLDKDDAGVTTLAGFAGAYGGMFSAAIINVALIMELANPGGRKYVKALVLTTIATAISFGIYFAIAGAVFLDYYKIPPFVYHSWELFAGVGFGVLAALIVLILGIVMSVSKAIFLHMKLPNIAKSAIGGIVFGLIGVLLPLTMFTGTDQLKTALDGKIVLGAGLLAALVIGKIVTFAVCNTSGFVGGPIFPSLFIGGTAGMTVHALFPSVPLGLAFTCVMAAVPGGLVSAPFSFVLMVAFLTRVGALQTAPILLAVITAFLIVGGVKYLIALRQEHAAAGAVSTAPASG